MSDETTPEEFKPIFRQGVLIIGGHAVNMWAGHYAGRGDVELLGFAPFISKDGDIHLKDPEIAQATAVSAGWQFMRNPEPRTAVLGVIYLENTPVRLKIHVMRTVNGLSDADLAKTATLALKDGTSYCVPAPDIMLKAKLSNLDIIDQKDRQDERHVRIMIPCCRHYLTDTFEAVGLSQLSEREAVDRFMETYRVTTSPVAQQLDKTWDLKLALAIPHRERLGDLARFQKLRAFYDHQIDKIGLRIRP